MFVKYLVYPIFFINKLYFLFFCKNQINLFVVKILFILIGFFMIRFFTTEKSFDHIKADGHVVFLENDFDKNILAEFTGFFPAIKEVIESRKFNGSASSSLVLTFCRDNSFGYLILLGLGKLKDNILNLEYYRRAVGNAVRIAENYKLNSLALRLPKFEKFAIDCTTLVQETASIAGIASYNYDDFISDPERKVEKDIQIFIPINSCHAKDVEAGIKKGEDIAQAVNKSRYWCDMPSANMYPEILANNAKEIAKKSGLKVTVFDKNQISDMAMGGIIGVGQGSDHDPRLVILEYHSDQKNRPTIAIVGKGVTFDSGGLSLKPAVHMETMKGDMAGAASVIATMELIAKLKPNVNVIGITPLVENMPSGKATRPGDVLRFYNGKTAEVKNTDAEGRLILADALSYAVKNYKLDAIIDVATLTGACAAALGYFYCGLMSFDDQLASKIEDASKKSGDRVWRFPMDEDYRVAIRSSISDMCNIGSDKYKAGAITAAFFLSNFVDDVPWAHMDIAGTSYGVPDMPYYRSGATGFGVRLLADLIMNW